MLTIDTNITPYVVFSEDTLLVALQKISLNKAQIICAVSDSGKLEGVMTNGDFLRWILKQDDVDLNQPVTQIMNTEYVYAGRDDAPQDITQKFSKTISVVPLVDGHHKLVAVAKKSAHKIKIDTFSISAEDPTFVIAEIGNNHNGSIKLAKELVDLAIDAGADCAKFQMRNMKDLYSNGGDANDAGEDLGSQYTLDLLSKFQLSNEEMIEVFDYCKEKGILPLCTPWDVASLQVLEGYGMHAYKVASADLTNHDLLEALAKTGKPMICSTGMSTENEIKESAKFLQELGAQYVLLHCNSTYPAPFKDIHLNYLERLKEISGSEVGYSGHERDIFVAVAAVAKGAKVIEKHFTVDKSMEGNDHKVSLLPEEFKNMVRGIRQVESALGNGKQRSISQGELINRENLAKSLVSTQAIKAGDTITAAMLTVKSPGKGLQPNRKKELIGSKAKRDFAAGDFFFASDLSSTTVEARPYDFDRPWGIPVRYHDFGTIITNTNPDLIEFHLSYKDLELNLADFFTTKHDMAFVVHAPELFAGDHILNLTSEDEDYRKRSIQDLQRVIDITRELKKYFTTKTPLIITNVGGFTHDHPLGKNERAALYKTLADSLSKLDTKGVEIIPQTMPPFPWHFGGQQYHNLFMDPQDIVDFCKKHKYRVCFDVSHSKLACNEHKWSFQEFVELVGPYTAHLHIVDASGVDGEGLQIGEGSIDFAALGKELRESCPDASFVPEIWQGHKNGGEGFWIALELLETYFKK